MARRTTEETRELLVNTAVEMLHEQGAYIGVTHVKMSDVVQRAGLTTGAAYRIWESQDDFHREVAVAAVRWRPVGSIDDTVMAIKDAVEGGLPVGETIRLASAANLRTLPDDAADLVSLTLRMAAPADDELAAASRQRHELAMEDFSALYAALLDVYRLRVRAPYTLRHLALALAALSEGFSIQGLSDVDHPVVERGDVEPGVGAQWTLFGCAAEGIIRALTEPVPPPSWTDAPPGRS